MSTKIESFLQQHSQYWPETYNAQLLRVRIAIFHAQFTQHILATEILTTNELSMVEFDVLAALRRSPPPYSLTPSDIQHAMLISSGGLTKVLIELEKRGLIIRTTNEIDKRIKPATLTDKALQLLDKTMNELNVVLNDWINQALSSSEIDQLSILLAKLVK